MLCLTFVRYVIKKFMMNTVVRQECSKSSLNIAAELLETKKDDLFGKTLI